MQGEGIASGAAPEASLCIILDLMWALAWTGAGADSERSCDLLR